MAEISAKLVQALRKKTGAGIMDCRRALEETGGDLDKAEQWLRESGKISAAKRQDRERSEGAVAVVVQGGTRPVGAIATLECETDFVAKSPEFVSLVEELADELAVNGEEVLAGYAGRIENLSMVLKENIALGRTVRFEAPETAVISSYLHLQNGRGVNAVLVELSGANESLAHDIAVHIAFARPEYLSRQRRAPGARRGLSQDGGCDRAQRGQAGGFHRQDRRRSASGVVQGAGAPRPTVCQGREADHRAGAR